MNAKTTDDSTAATVTHLGWCWPASCTTHDNRDDYTPGSHLHIVERFRPKAGGQLEVVLSRNAEDNAGPPHYVAVLRPVDQDFHCAGGGHRRQPPVAGRPADPSRARGSADAGALSVHGRRQVGPATSTTAAPTA